MQTVIPITQARSQLPSLINKLPFEETLISSRGKVKAALIDAEEYIQLKETLAVLSDQETMKSIDQGLKDIAEGNLVDWEYVQS